MELIDLLRQMIKQGASDLHLVSDCQPILRLDGELHRTRGEKLTPEECRRLLYSAMTDKQKARYEAKHDIDFSLSVKGLARFRVNIHMQRGTAAGAFRAIPHEIKTADELRLPEVCKQLARLPRGLVLVTGPTGSGKSTSLAALIDQVNNERQCHIITVEDPIEFLHHHKRSIIEQREVESDTDTFAEALKYAMRQDPDVILIGEMRDLETIAAAITSAETGHLVFATLHTTDAPQTVDRIIDVFPPHQQEQIRVQLASVLEGVLSQTLLPHASGRGRVCGVEVMLGTDAVRSQIREAKTHLLYGTIETSHKVGMQSLDRALGELLEKRMITKDEALRKVRKPEEFRRVYGVG